MVRPVKIEPSPQFHPFKCIRCKTAAGPLREYFIDLGLDISGEFNPMYDGNIYYCNECALNLVTDFVKVIQEWDIDHSPWNGDDKSAITYNWEEVVHVDGAVTSGSSDGTETSSSEPERVDPVPTPADEVPERTVPDVSKSSISITRDGFTGFS